MTEFQGLCANCGEEMTFQSITNHEKVSGSMMKSCLDTEDYGNLYEDYGQSKEVAFECSCGKPELTAVDREELEGMYEIRQPKTQITRRSHELAKS